jgi:hypothetical protein
VKTTKPAKPSTSKPGRGRPNTVLELAGSRRSKSSRAAVTDAYAAAISALAINPQLERVTSPLFNFAGDHSLRVTVWRDNKKPAGADRTKGNQK